MTISSLPAPKKHPKFLTKVFVGIGIVVVGVPALFATWLMIAMGGGPGQVWLTMQPKPDFGGSHMTSLRNDAKRQLTNSLVNDIPQTFQKFATSTSDRCQRGQHNYEVKDPYAYACSYVQTGYYGFDGDFSQSIIGLDDALVRAGWAHQDLDVQGLLDGYYKVYYKGPGTGYTVGNLPGVDYTKGHMQMRIQWIERGDTELTLFSNDLSRFNGYQTWQVDHEADAQKTAANIFQTHRFAMSVAIEDIYYQR